ncbi:MAG TPA: hypothetical protein VIY66_11605 [Candidatus Acidoferrales bacterium]
MKIVLSILLLGILSFPSFAAKKNGDFPLQVHIVKVDMGTGQTDVSGSGRTDSNGNYSSDVSGGGSYLYHVYTVHVDGSHIEYKMTTPARHFKGGTGLAIATLGWSAVATSRGNDWLQIGEYKGHWNKDGSLEIQFLDEKDKFKHQPFFIRAEAPLPSEQTSAGKQPNQ